MVIITGQKPYGKCDHVPGLFYVATWFFYLNYFPLVPLGTRLILGQTGDTYRYIPLPFSAKSLFYAWSRTALGFGGIIAWIFTALALSGNHDDIPLTLPLLLATLCTVFFLYVMIVPRRRLPSYERACQLATIAQLTERGWAALNVLYGRDITDRPTPPNPSGILPLR